MLVLSRRRSEKVIIDLGGRLITVTIIEVDRGKVRLGFDAPTEIPIHREEVYQAIQNEK